MRDVTPAKTRKVKHDTELPAPDPTEVALAAVAVALDPTATPKQRTDVLARVRAITEQRARDRPEGRGR